MRLVKEDPVAALSFKGKLEEEMDVEGEVVKEVEETDAPEQRHQSTSDASKKKVVENSLKGW